MKETAWRHRLLSMVAQVGINLDQAVYGYFPTLSVEIGGGLFVTNLKNSNSNSPWLTTEKKDFPVPAIN